MAIAAAARGTAHFTMSLLLEACASLVAPKPGDMAQVVEQDLTEPATLTSSDARPVSCDDTFDALHYACPDGRSFSVRPSPDFSCAVIFAGEGTYVVQRAATSEGRLDNGGTVSLRVSQDSTRATLSGVPDGDFVDCDAELD